MTSCRPLCTAVPARRFLVACPGRIGQLRDADLWPRVTPVRQPLVLVPATAAAAWWPPSRAAVIYALVQLEVRGAAGARRLVTPTAAGRRARPGPGAHGGSGGGGRDGGVARRLRQGRSVTGASWLMERPFGQVLGRRFGLGRRDIRRMYSADELSRRVTRPAASARRAPSRNASGRRRVRAGGALIVRLGGCRTGEVVGFMSY